MRNIRRKLDKEALEYNYWLFNVMKEDLEIRSYSRRAARHVITCRR